MAALTPTDIRLLQMNLSRLGFRPGPLDGLWGRRTEGALRKFQNREGVIASGQMDRETTHLLDLALKQSEDRIATPTVSQLQQVTAFFRPGWLGALIASIRWAHITLDRLPAYLAQLGHESDSFKTLEEYADGAAYEGRVRTLGNTEPGDGRRFKGRGAIQITGRRNYTRAGEALNLPLTEQPELLLVPENGFKASAWYWLDANLNAITDTGDFVALTKAINGGDNGLDHRQALLKRAQKMAIDLTPDSARSC